MVAILMMPAKLATLGFLRIKIFWNEGYIVIISVHDAISKIHFVTQILVDVVMWPKFSNSSISMREVIINSIL